MVDPPSIKYVMKVVDGSETFIPLVEDRLFQRTHCRLVKRFCTESKQEQATIDTLIRETVRMAITCSVHNDTS